MPYLADVAAPTNTPGTVNVSCQIYAVSSDTPTAFLLWLATPGLTDHKELGRIVLLHSIYKSASRLGRPVTKRDTKAFAAMGDVVAGLVALANLEPRYLNLLRQPVNVPSPVAIDTALDITPAPLLLDPMADDDAISTAI